MLISKVNLQPHTMFVGMQILTSDVKYKYKVNLIVLKLLENVKGEPDA